MSLYDQMVVKRTLSPASRSANSAVNGVAVDRAVNGGMQDATVIVSTGTITDGSHAVAVEDSADGSTGWASVPAGQLLGAPVTVVAADDDKMFEIGVLSSRQFLRVTITTSGATTGGIFGAAIALSSPRFSPVTHP